MESGKVDESVSGEEKVGNERGDGVELGDEDAAQGDDERQHVPADRFVVLAVAAPERLQVRVQLVLAQRLEHFRCRHEAGQSRAQRRRETTGVDQRTERRHQFDDLRINIQISHQFTLVFFLVKNLFFQCKIKQFV